MCTFYKIQTPHVSKQFLPPLATSVKRIAFCVKAPFHCSESQNKPISRSVEEITPKYSDYSSLI